MSRVALVKARALALMVLAAVGLALILGTPDIAAMRSRVEAAGPWRLVPLVPFIAINYASGLSGVRFRPYVVGGAAGMAPGSLAYAALGAYGTSPWGLAAAGSALVGRSTEDRTHA